MPFYKYIFILIMAFSINTQAWEEGFAYNGDIKIAYRDYGPLTGDPILLVQGLGGQLINWPDHLCQSLCSRFSGRSRNTARKRYWAVLKTICNAEQLVLLA